MKNRYFDLQDLLVEVRHSRFYSERFAHAQVCCSLWSKVTKLKANHNYQSLIISYAIP